MTEEEQKSKRVRRPDGERPTTIGVSAAMAQTIDAARRDGESRGQCAMRLIREALAK